VIDHYDEMRVAPDPSLAEELRKRLHARMASAQRDEHEDRSELQPDAGGVEPDQQLAAVTEIYVAPDSSSTETRYRRRLAMAVAAVVAFVGVAAIVINSLNSDDAEAPSPAVTPTLAQTTAAAPSTLAISTTTEPVGVPGALPDGTYRVEITLSDLQAVNASNYYLLVGTWEWTFRGGDWSYQNTSTSARVESTAAGTYVVEGDHITFYVPSQLWGDVHGPHELTWQANPDGSLQFTSLSSTDPPWAALFASHPLVPTT
jgi:hypothetical protein